VIETYSEGMIVRWIDETQPGQPEPDHPAPILRLAAAAPGTAPTTTAAPAPTTTAPAPTSAPVEDTADTSGNSGSIWWLIGAAIIVVGAVVAALLVRRRSSPPTDGLEQ
jgi:periplasmic copper chaperone A